MGPVEEDFEDFVTARWRELHAVALVTTGDHGRGTHATAEALARLRPRWVEVTSSGSPTAAARTAVLTAALSATAHASTSPTSIAATTGGAGLVFAVLTPDAGSSPSGPLSSGPAVATDHNEVAAALETVLATADPVARAALAARHWWDQDSDLVAACARTDVGSVDRARASLEERLANAHAHALRRDAREVDWLLADAVGDTLDGAADRAPATDSLGVVAAARATSTRRRSVRAAVAGLLAVVVVATVAGVAALTPEDTGPTRLPLPPATSAVWADVSTWPARGSLVDDPTVMGIAAERQRGGLRLLYAGPVGDTVALLLGSGDAGGATRTVPPSIRLWSAPARIGASALVEQTIDGDITQSAKDVVSVVVPQDDGTGSVLVLTRPTVTEGLLRTGARPKPDGTVVPLMTRLEAEGGVAVAPVAASGFAATLVMGGFTGKPAGQGYVHGLPTGGTAQDLADAHRAIVADVTGYPVSRLETTVVADEPVDPTHLAFVGNGPSNGGARLVVVTTGTPDGGLVRAARLSGYSQDSQWSFDLEYAAAVPAEEPAFALIEVAAEVPTFVVLAPTGATAELRTADGATRDRSTVASGVAVLTSPRDVPGAVLSLRVRDSLGRVVHDAVPAPLVDLTR